MDLFAPISSIMTTDLITVDAADSLQKVRDIFENHRIHHVPVVQSGKMKGLISKADFLLFTRGFNRNKYDDLVEESRLNNHHAEDIMTKGLASLEPDDRINVALEIFKENLFHAIPIIKNGTLVGIVTTYDVISALTESREISIS